MSAVNPTDRAKRQYKIRLWISMAVYVAIIVPVANAASHAQGSMRIVLALTPLLPIIAVFVSAVAMFRGIDELDRQIHIESLAIAAAIVALLSATYGFLEIAHFPHPSAWFTYGAVMLAWAVATPFVARRYKE